MKRRKSSAHGLVCANKKAEENAMPSVGRFHTDEEKTTDLFEIVGATKLLIIFTFEKGGKKENSTCARLTNLLLT